MLAYDSIREELIALNGCDGLRENVFASLLSGVFATTMTNPIDVIKTRIMIGTQKSVFLFKS